MFLTDFLKKTKEYFTCYKFYDEKTKRIIIRQFGHTKTYDIQGQQGCILTDSFENRKEHVTITYYPGTKSQEIKGRVLTESHVSKKTTDFWEKWYLLGGKSYAFVKGQQSDPNLTETKVYTKQDGRYLFPYGVLKNLLNQNMVLDWRTDLKKVAKNLSDEMGKVIDDKAVRAQYMSSLSEKEKQIAKEAVEAVVEGLRAHEDASQSHGESEVARKEKTAEEIKREHWTEQLEARKQKYALLKAQKAKIETSVRMKPERKSERLISLEKRIQQNEKAQAILNRKLAILEAVKKRETLKQVQQEKRRSYKDMNVVQKQKREEILSLSKETPAAEVAEKRLSLRQIKQAKQASYQEYRLATRSVKMAGKSLKKLRDVKRQNTIFEVMKIEQEQKAVWQALATEKDLFVMGDLLHRMHDLRLQKRSLFLNYKNKGKPQVASVAQVPQPMLPGMAEQLNR